MTICYLTPSDRTEVIPPPLIRPPKKRPEFNGRDVISAAEFQRLPAHEKAGFLLAHDKGFYFRKWSPRDSRREAAHRLVEASKSPTHENDQLGISEMLSQRGAKKIAESCEYMSIKQGGYRTFATATFDQDVRAMLKREKYQKVASRVNPDGTEWTEIALKPVTTIQREVSRFMDAMQKMYQRGWFTSDGKSIKGSAKGLCYCWVAEVPTNERGEENPHVHFLMNWRVPYWLFDDWARRIESMWGNGTVHLEKIKDVACAGAYMAKAAGYLSKAAGDDSQGEVRGNRYGISAPARAPSWVSVGWGQLHSMGQIIADVYDHLTLKYGADYQRRKRLKAELDATPKDNKTLRQEIGEKLQAVRKKLNALPIRCNKYQVILKGQTVAGLFLTWAKGEKVSRPEWLPELPKEFAWQAGKEPTAADSIYFRKLKEKFQWLKRCRHAWTDSMLSSLVEQWESLKADALSAYESWSSWTCVNNCTE